MRVRKYAVAVAFLAIVVLLNLPASVARRAKSASRDELAPFQNVAGLIVGAVRDTVSVIFRARQTLSEHESLTLQLVQLQQEVRDLRLLETENADLRKLLDFKRRQAHVLVLCRVISRGDATGWWQTVQLDKGSSEGIRTNMPAITSEGLVGKVSGVSRHAADLILITDPNCKLSCFFVRTGAYGIARGAGVTFGGEQRLEVLSGPSPVRVDYVGKAFPLIKGDDVVTSGLGGVYPEGLPVGRVTATRMDDSGLYQRADLEPAADIGTMRYVFVMTD